MSNPTWPDVMKFELKGKPILFDVGGYKGDWAQIATDRYGESTIYIFEPVSEFYNIISERYKGNTNIKVYNFGLSDQNRTEKISLRGDSSSVFVEGGDFEEIKLRDIREFLFEEKIFHVDLIKINIEGEEYRLLEYLIKTPELNIFENYLIQFHGYVENYVERRDGIIKELAVYYDRIFNYDFIFEGWSIKKVQKINCVGDSHISVFSSSSDLIGENVLYESDLFKTYRVGPYLAYNLLEKHDALSKANTFDKNENILICLGEIDCRAQVHTRIDTEHDYKFIVNDVVQRYIQGLKCIKNENLIVFSIAPDRMENPFSEYYTNNKDVFDCPRGNYEERRKYKEYFNERLKEEAEANGYKYLSIYEYLVNEKDSKEIYFVDDIHLNPSRVQYLIKREMIKTGLIISNE